MLAAVYSSLRERALPRELVLMGEVGLSGELRPVANGEARIKATQQHGFKQVILPEANRPRYTGNTTGKMKFSLYGTQRAFVRVP